MRMSHAALAHTTVTTRKPYHYASDAHAYFILAYMYIILIYSVNPVSAKPTVRYYRL